MKKVLLSIICIVCIVSCLSACSKKEEVVEVPNTVENEDIANVLEFKGEYLKEYKNMEVPEVRKFLGTAVVNVRPKEYRKFDLPVISNTDTDFKLVMNLMHLEEEWLDDFVISITKGNTRAYTVAFLKPKSNYVEQVVTSVKYRLEDLNRTLVNYPDQMYLLNNAEINQVGDFLVIVICDNADKVYKEFYEVMESVDLANLNEVPMMTENERKKIEDEALQKEIDLLYEEIDEVIVTPVEEPIEEPIEESIENNFNTENSSEIEN